MESGAAVVATRLKETVKSVSSGATELLQAVTTHPAKTRNRHAKIRFATMLLPVNRREEFMMAKESIRRNLATLRASRSPTQSPPDILFPNHHENHRDPRPHAGRARRTRTAPASRCPQLLPWARAAHHRVPRTKSR